MLNLFTKTAVVFVCSSSPALSVIYVYKSCTYAHLHVVLRVRNDVPYDSLSCSIPVQYNKQKYSIDCRLLIAVAAMRPIRLKSYKSPLRWHRDRRRGSSTATASTPPSTTAGRTRERWSTPG